MSSKATWNIVVCILWPFVNIEWILILFTLPVLRMSLCWTDGFMKLVVAWHLSGYYSLVELLKQIKSYRSYSRMEGCLICTSVHTFLPLWKRLKICVEHTFENPASHPHLKESERDILLPVMQRIRVWNWIRSPHEGWGWGRAASLSMEHSLFGQRMKPKNQNRSTQGN